MLAVAKLTQPDYFKLAASTGRAQLIIIPYSHFCDLSSWALELAGVDHDKHCFAPGAHVFPSLRVRLGGGKRHVSSSSAMAAVGADRAEKGSDTAVPLCVLPDGETVLPDSWSIATELAGLEPPPAELKRRLDEELGPLARQMAYSLYLKTGNADIWHALAGDGGSSRWWRFAGWRVTQKLRRMLRPEDEEAVCSCRERLRAAFAALASEAERRGAELRAGERRPDAGDLALAALASSVVQPEEKCGGHFRERYAALLARDQAAKDEVEHFRATPLGQFTLWMYRQYRVRGTVAALGGA